MKHSTPDRRAVHWLMAFAAMLDCLAAQASETWTLESSIERAIAVAPELEMRAAAIRAQQAATRQAGAWPNPSMEIRADNRLARELGDSGYDVTELAVSQPLAWGISKARRTVAERELAVHESAAHGERLDLERRVAVAYHRLQREQTLLTLARKHWRKAGSSPHPKHGASRSATFRAAKPCAWNCWRRRPRSRWRRPKANGRKPVSPSPRCWPSPGEHR